MGLVFFLALYRTPHIPKQREDPGTQRESPSPYPSPLGLSAHQHQLCPASPASFHLTAA